MCGGVLSLLGGAWPLRKRAALIIPLLEFSEKIGEARGQRSLNGVLRLEVLPDWCSDPRQRRQTPCTIRGVQRRHRVSYAAPRSLHRTSGPYAALTEKDKVRFLPIPPRRSSNASRAGCLLGDALEFRPRLPHGTFR